MVETDGMVHLARALYETWERAWEVRVPWDEVTPEYRAAWRAVAEHAERALVGEYINPGPLVRLRMPRDDGSTLADIYVRPLAVTECGLWASVPYDDPFREGLAGVTHAPTGWAVLKGVPEPAAWAALDMIEQLGDVPAFRTDDPAVLQRGLDDDPRLAAIMGAIVYRAEHWDEVASDPDA